MQFQTLVIVEDPLRIRGQVVLPDRPFLRVRNRGCPTGQKGEGVLKSTLFGERAVGDDRAAQCRSILA